MKKLFIIISLIFFSFTAFCQNLKLISFNMKGRTSDPITSFVAQMIISEQADIIFLQEVYIRSKAAPVLASITRKLPGNWGYASTYDYSLWQMKYTPDGTDTYKTCNSNQNNAILYNRSRVALTDLAGEAGFTNFDGSFLFDKNNVQLVRFTKVQLQSSGVLPEDNSTLEASAPSFIAINVHLPYTDYEHRLRDLSTLERLYAHYKLKEGVIIAGDFNTYRQDLTKRNFDFVDGKDSWYSDLNFGLRTSLSTKGTDKILFASDYDHFVFNKKITLKNKMQRVGTPLNSRSVPSIQIGQEAFASSVEFREAVSDHIPIWIEIEF